MISSPVWIPVLYKAGYFSSPPLTKRVSSGSVQYPNWPASKYLIRMAAHAPAEVADILVKLETDNASVFSDIIDAAISMPAQNAASLVPSISRALKQDTPWLFYPEVYELCVKLAEEGAVDTSLELADAVFAPTFEEGNDTPRGRDDYWYKEGLAKVVPILVPRAPKKFLNYICAWLKLFVDAMKHIDPDTGSDISCIWRPAIEEHEQNRDYDLASVVAGFVRQAFEQAVQDDCITLDDALDLIGEYSYLIFRRIRLHLINKFSGLDPELAIDEMMNRRNFDNPEFKHEYAMLVGNRFQLLDRDQREEWYGWVDAGPDLSGEEGSSDEQASPMRRQSRIKWWQYSRLHWVKNHLDGARLDQYETMLAEHGEPELADLNFRMGSGMRGEESPMKVDDLIGIPFDEALDKIVSWEPDTSQFMGPSIEGLAATFKSYVATDPPQFSTKAGALNNKPAIYVRGFIAQMNEAIRTGLDIDVHSVIKLCEWVVECPVEERTTPKQQHEGLIDKDWHWTRDEIAGLTESICKAMDEDKPRYPLERLRESLWGLISNLSRDRAKSYIVRDTSQGDPRTSDYLDLGINSPRGKAIEAALEYARWVANHIKEVVDTDEIVPGGFDAMPEVRDMLTWQIKADNRNPCVMSIIGSRIGLVYWIDKDWLAQNCGSLFDLQGIERAPAATEGWCAWNAYLVWGRPHIELYRLFKEQYSFAVEQAATVEQIEESRNQPMYRLGEHLMVFYGRDQLGMNDDDGLLNQFITSAHPNIRQHTIAFVGRSLATEDDIPKDVVGRFKKLWDFYWNTGLGRKDAEDKPDSRIFGTWFECGKFSIDWSIDQMLQVTEIVPTPRPGHKVVEILSENASVDIVKVTRILDRIIRGDREGWRMSTWLDQAKIILKQALDAGDEAQECAESLINYLGRQGYIDIGELLKLNE